MDQEKSHTSINSLSELRQRKEMLKLEMKITRQSIGTSIKHTEDTIKSNILRKIIVPLGAGSLASMLFKEHQMDEEKPSWLLFLQQMLEKINEYYPNYADEVNPTEE